MGNIRYQLSGDEQNRISSRLLYVTFSRYERDWYSLKHSHPFTELFYVLDGKGEFIVEDSTFPIVKNDLVILNMNIEHTEVSMDTSPLEYIILGVEGINFSFENNKEYTIFNCGNNRENLMFYFTSMLTELENKDKHSELICQDLLEVLIINLTRYTNYAFGIVPIQKTNRECARIKRYLESSFLEDITLESLAEMAHLSKYYFVHAFTQYYGISPINYLNMQRIQASKELLLSTDHSIADIARLAGFSSQSYFAQCFRKSCGMSARSYRRSIRQQQT